MENLISQNADGIDIEVSKGLIQKNKIFENRDDGVDYDGDADVKMIKNEIISNMDKTSSRTEGPGRYFVLPGVITILILLFPGIWLAMAENLVYNGDFEIDSTTNPPPGWVMWGARKYKVPENYTRDTTNPHSGKACFRMHHLANTAGYIVTSPKYAIQPKKGMAYYISFWAQTDKPGMSVFYLDGYSSLEPYKEAPSPGRFPFLAEENWKHFRFEIHEGRDFRADENRYILLAFRITMNNREEKTLWLDDVVIREEKSTLRENLIDEATLKYPPLEHRLRPGDELAFTVDVKNPLRHAKREVAGVSFHRVAGWTRAPYNKEGQYTLTPELERSIREMRLPMTRFYGVGDEKFSLEASIDKVADVCKRVQIPLESVVLEFETQSASRKLSPEVWASGVRYAMKKGYPFRYWEISNEPYTRKATAFASPDDYVAHFLAVSAAIREVQPDAQIGIAINPASQSWGNYVLKQAAGHYDFVVGHHYCSIENLNQRNLEVAALTENYKKLNAILRLNALIRAYNPKRNVYQYDTEWGLAGSGPNGESPEYVNRNANIFGTLHRAVRLIYYTREDILAGASSWEMFSRKRTPGFGVLTPDAPDKWFMIYWLYYYFNRHVGEQVVAIDGTAPYYKAKKKSHESLQDYPSVPDDVLNGPLTPPLATVSKDGKTVYLVIANGSWDKAVPCRVDFRNFTPGKARGILLSDDEVDGSPFVNHKEDLIKNLSVNVSNQRLMCIIPAHSVVFITVTSKGGKT